MLAEAGSTATSAAVASAASATERQRNAGG